MKHWMRKPLYGKGINDSDYVTQPSVGERCPFFDRWHSMIRRCYSSNKSQRYDGCTVSSEWLTFSKFKEWMISQEWEGMALDKDILIPGNKIYSKENCVFVPQYVNSAFSGSGNDGKVSCLPLGVTRKPRLKTNPYIAQGVELNVRTHLGVHSTPELAHRAWLNWRMDSIYKVIVKYTESTHDDRVVARLESFYLNLAKVFADGLVIYSISEAL